MISRGSEWQLNYCRRHRRGGAAVHGAAVHGAARHHNATIEEDCYDMPKAALDFVNANYMTM